MKVDKNMMVPLAVLVIGAAAILLTNGSGEREGQQAAVQGDVVSDADEQNTVSDPGTMAEDGVVRIPLSTVSEEMKVHSYDAGGTEVRYLVVLGGDGRVRTAFDACEVCGGAKGYAQSGGDVVCRNCGRHFLIDDLGTENRGGGCWPAYLPHTIEDGYIVVRESGLESGRRFF